MKKNTKKVSRGKTKFDHRKERSKSTDWLKYKKYAYPVLVGIILFVALFVRIYHLESLPPGVYPDEAIHGTDAIQANEASHWKLFYENNYGREGLFINLIALGFKLFGVSAATLRIWSAAFGIFTVLGMILLTRELFGGWRAGAIAGFLTATSFWHLNFSRIAFRAIMLPFVLVFSFYFLLRGLRTKKLYNYILAGVFFGLGIHTYIAFRIAPLILIALLAALIAAKKNFLKNHWKEIAVFTLLALLTASPMLADFYSHPEHFSARTGSVSVLNPEVNQGHLFKALGISAALNLGSFNFHGDQNWRHNLPSQPELQFIIGLFFLAGLGYLAWQFFHLMYQRIKNRKHNDNLAITVLLLSWFAVMLLPGILTYEGLPHSLRVIGALPAVLLISACFIELVFRQTDKIKSANLKTVIYIFLILSITWSGFVSVKRYFIDWGQSLEVRQAFNQNFTEMAAYLNELPEDINKYVVVNGGGKTMDDGLPISAHVIKLLTYSKTPSISYLDPNFNPASLKPIAKVVLMNYDKGIENKIRAVFSNAITMKVISQPGSEIDFFVININ